MLQRATSSHARMPTVTSKWSDVLRHGWATRQPMRASLERSRRNGSFSRHIGSTRRHAARSSTYLQTLASLVSRAPLARMTVLVARMAVGNLSEEQMPMSLSWYKRTNCAHPRGIPCGFRPDPESGLISARYPKISMLPDCHAGSILPCISLLPGRFHANPPWSDFGQAGASLTSDPSIMESRRWMARRLPPNEDSTAPQTYELARSRILPCDSTSLLHLQRTQVSS